MIFHPLLLDFRILALIPLLFKIKGYCHISNLTGLLSVLVLPLTFIISKAPVSLLYCALKSRVAGSKKRGRGVLAVAAGKLALGYLKVDKVVFKEQLTFNHSVTRVRTIGAELDSFLVKHLKPTASVRCTSLATQTGPVVRTMDGLYRTIEHDNSFVGQVTALYLRQFATGLQPSHEYVTELHRRSRELLHPVVAAMT